jgi:hypothetical protein
MIAAGLGGVPRAGGYFEASLWRAKARLEPGGARLASDRTEKDDGSKPGQDRVIKMGERKPGRENLGKDKDFRAGEGAQRE